jgi:nucleoside-diphosphate-sugar epimerase
MSKNILILGGTRFFGKILVQRLLDAGHRVTIATRGLTPDAFGNRVQRVQVDRKSEFSMQAAFANAPFYDLVYDQMCYTPLDAALAIKTFAGKTPRYVMASTIEVYETLQGKLDRPYAEGDLDLAQVSIEMDYPWADPAGAQRYGAGKLQSEALLYQDGRLPFVSVRIAHVLAGPEDFTGRLAPYVDLAGRGEALHYAAQAGSSSFTQAEAIADFLHWVGEQNFLGPINSACDGELSATDLYERACILLGQPLALAPVAQQREPNALSPYDYPFRYAMDTAHAKALGYRFSRCTDWLDELLRQHAAGLRLNSVAI